MQNYREGARMAGMTADQFQQAASHPELFEQITLCRKKGITHQGPPEEDGHDVNHADGVVPHTSNGAQGDTDRQA